MVQALLAAGAGTVIGWDNIVDRSFNATTMVQFFQRFLGPPSLTTGEAFKPVIDPDLKHAELVMKGSNSLKASTSSDLLNGDFEKGYWGFWDTSAYPLLTSRFGDYHPKAGRKMAVLSNSNKVAITNTSGISQKICLPENAASLEFDWRHVTEDYSVCRGDSKTPSNDAFTVRFDLSAFFSTHVKDQCSNLKESKYMFNILPTKETEWKHTSIPITDFAKSHAGMPVTLFFDVYDQWCCGIDWYGDTAVILDNVKIVKSGE